MIFWKFLNLCLGSLISKTKDRSPYLLQRVVVVVFVNDIIKKNNLRNINLECETFWIQVEREDMREKKEKGERKQKHKLRWVLDISLRTLWQPDIHLNNVFFSNPTYFSPFLQFLCFLLYSFWLQGLVFNKKKS